METPVTLFQLIAAVVMTLVAALSPRLYDIYQARLQARKEARAQELEAEKAERTQNMEAGDKAISHWEKVAQEYARQIDTLRRVETEVAELRPLVLRNALLQQEITQVREDKEDWKAYALRLAAQLEEKNIIALPFRRTPHDDDAQEKLRTISEKMKAIKTESESSKTATTDVPTLTFPKEGG